MTVLGLATALWLGSSLVLFSTWCVRVYASTQLAPGADATTKVVWWCGRGLIWAGALALGSAIVGTAVAVAWRAVI